MQLKIILKAPADLIIPCNYNYQIQSAIYSLLRYDKYFSNYLHEVGFGRSERKFKLFTFSPLEGGYKIKDKRISFTTNISLELRSIFEPFIEIAEKALKQQGHLKLFDKKSAVESIKRTDHHVDKDTILIRTRSPIIARIRKSDHSTIYLSPDQPDFYRLINENFKNKYESFYDEYPTTDLSLESKGEHRKTVTRYKDHWITAYSGGFLLHSDAAYLDFLYQTGLGSRNSQGFGMFDIIK